MVDKQKDVKGKPEDTPGHGKEDAPGHNKPEPKATTTKAKTTEEDDYRNYPQSPEPGKPPQPYPPAGGSLPTDDHPDPAPPSFPIGTPPTVLAPEPTEGETDQERVDNMPKPETPAHCPTCRGRGFIGGTVCPDCDGTGLGTATVKKPLVPPLVTKKKDE